MKMILWLILLFSIFSNSILAQHDYNWVFDSILVKFDANGIVATGNSMAAQYTNETSWSDIMGNLVVYSRGSDGPGLYNRNHILVSNSLGIKHFRQHQATVFLPFSEIDKIVIVSKDPPTTANGCDVWYHVYNITKDSLIQKNESFLPTGIGFKMATGATRHANGRDWWVVNHESVGRKFYTTLVTANGFETPIIQEIGSKHGYDTP